MTSTAYLALNQNDLAIEKQQCIDEGKDISALEAEFEALNVPDVHLDEKLRARAGKLLDKTARLPIRSDYPFVEPSQIGRIRRQRSQGPKLSRRLPSGEVLMDKAYGAWAGRAAGCLLGKPVEGRRSKQIEAYLRSQNRWPLEFYFSNQASEEVRKANSFPEPTNACYAENIRCMIEDDDTNYTTTGLALIKKHGLAMTSDNIAEFWLNNMPVLHTYTAERVTYRNLLNLLPTPDNAGKFTGRFCTATYRNPYREWIGAQIRGDFFGYVSPADPQQAAELACRDACISHVKNGIYGEMWVAAMLAAAYVSDDIETVIRAGLAQIPANCRLHRDIEEVLGWKKAGLSYEQVFAEIHKKWNEAFGHHWCHTNSNAQIVAMALLWGEMDYSRTICNAVMPGFDTDCNGATAGSVLGLMLGYKALPEKWIVPMNDTLQTGVHGYYEVRLAEVARQTVELALAAR